MIRTRNKPRLADQVVGAAKQWRTRSHLQAALGCSRKDITRLLSHLVDTGQLSRRDGDNAREYRAARDL